MLTLKWIKRSALALFVVVVSFVCLALLAFVIFFVVVKYTPLETKLAWERQRFIEYQKTPDKFRYIDQTGLVLRIPASYFLYDYAGATMSTDPCLNEKACAAGKPVKQTYFSFVWPSGGEQDYETAFDPLHPDRVRVVVSADYDDGNCRPGGWFRSCQGDPAEVLAKWMHYGYVQTNSSETLYGLRCHSTERDGTIEWLCFGERAGAGVVLTITLKNDSGSPPNPGSSISYVYPGARKPIYVSIHVSSKHAADWPQIVDRSRVLISQWTVPE